MNFSDLGHWIHSPCRLDRQKTLDWDEAEVDWRVVVLGKCFGQL